MTKRAIVLAGGKGTRLIPFTSLIPKPLVPLGGRYSILEIIILQLRDAGFLHITLAINHLARLIMAYFGDGSRLGVHIDYSFEESELGEIGPLTLIDDLPNSFLVMNGDILCDLDYREFFESHISSRSPISVSAYQRDVKIDFGVLSYDSSGFLKSFEEKPEYHFDVSMGVYCINKSIIESLAPNQKYGFDNLMLDCLARGLDVNVSRFHGYWLDIGRPEDYDYANTNFDAIAMRFGIK